MLGNTIDTSFTITEDLLTNWNNIIDILVEKHILRRINIDINIAHKYRGDLNGLFLELEVDKEYIYPHVRVNGYSDSSAYDGKQVSFALIDDKTLRKYYRAFKNKNTNI